ncbi:MAG TPA: hypothetical protein PKK60_01750 [archaeon]|nr:hypothetical protein [archaeon]
MYDSSLDKLKKILEQKTATSEGFDLKSQEKRFDELNFLLSKEKKVVDELKKQINFSNVSQVLLGCDALNNKDVYLSLIKFAIESKKIPIFVLTTTNYNQFFSYLSENQIDSNKILVIDTVSKNISKINETDYLFFVDSLRNLTQLQIKIIKIFEISKLNVSDFVLIFDSVDVLSLYHDEQIILKFVYSLTKILHKNSVFGVFLSSNRLFSPRLAQFFDDFVEIKKI